MQKDVTQYHTLTEISPTMSNDTHNNSVVAEHDYRYRETQRHGSDLPHISEFLQARILSYLELPGCTRDLYDDRSSAPPHFDDDRLPVLLNA